MFGAPVRPLPFPLDRTSNLEVLTDDERLPCGVPEFPEDSDERITVLFRLSLNEFVALATAIDVGSDIAYSTDGIKVWWLWQVSVMCAQFCEEVALCLTNEDPAVVEALANLITTNQTIINAISNSITNAGGAIPGQPISQQQAASDTLPPNVRNEEDECILNALWGACVYLVQSGNRAITDFFEQLEAASNTLETAAIVSQTIPAAGPYASAAAEFADQLQETLAEGYAGAYTETYENELACALFCLARVNCELTPDMLVEVMNSRLEYGTVPAEFGTVMARIGTGVFIGSQIADSMFYIYFTALRFGQQFGEILGFRPLTDLMSLGADLLASNNWETLCDCPEEWEQVFDFEVDDGGFTAPYGSYSEGVGWIAAEIEAGLFYTALSVSINVVTSINYMKAEYDMAGVTGDPQTDRIWKDSDTGANYLDSQTNADGTGRVLEYDGADIDVTALGFTAAVSACVGAFCGGDLVLKKITVRGFGTNPFI